jgi:hypothetical protein
MRVDQNLSVRGTLIGDKSTRDLARIVNVRDFDVDDERVVMRVVRKNPPRAMPRLPPALKRERLEKRVFERGRTRKNAHIRSRDLAGGTANPHNDHHQPERTTKSGSLPRRRRRCTSLRLAAQSSPRLRRSPVRSACPPSPTLNDLASFKGWEVLRAGKNRSGQQKKRDSGRGN